MSNFTKSYLLAMCVAVLAVMGTAMLAGALIGPEIATTIETVPLF